MSQSDSLLVKFRKHYFVINQSDSVLLKFRKYCFATFFAGSLGGFTCAALSSHSLQIVMIGAIIGGLSYSSAESVSLLGNTWWQRALLWGTTMAITIGGLIHLLLPSVHYSFLPHLIGFLVAGLPYYLARGQKGLIHK